MFKGLRDRFLQVSRETQAKPVDAISEVVDDSGIRLKDDVLDGLLHELEL